MYIERLTVVVRCASPTFVRRAICVCQSPFFELENMYTSGVRELLATVRAFTKNTMLYCWHYACTLTFVRTCPREDARASSGDCRTMITSAMPVRYPSVCRGDVSEHICAHAGRCTCRRCNMSTSVRSPCENDRGHGHGYVLPFSRDALPCLSGESVMSVFFGIVHG